MSLRRLPFAVIAFAAVASAALPGSAPTDVFARLGDADPAVREQAFVEVWAAGESARPRLIAEADTGNLEKRERCRRLISILDLGLPPALAPAVVNAILSYDYDAPDDAKRRLIRAAAPAAAVSPAMLKIGIDEPSPAIRQMILAQSTRDVGPYLDRLADAGPAGRAELEKFVRVYERSFARATDRIDVGRTLLTVSVTLADQNAALAAAVDELRADANRSDGEQIKLARLLAAAGRDGEALAVLEERPDEKNTPRRAAVAALRLRTGDWRGAVKLADDGNLSLPLQIAGRLVFGDDASARELANTDAQTPDQPDVEYRRAAARLNLLAGRVKEGVDQYAGIGEVGILRAQGRWAEALKLGQIPNLPSAVRQRQREEQEALRRDVGEAPPVKPKRLKGDAANLAATQVALTPAADAYRRGDFAAALKAVDVPLAVPAQSAEDYVARTAGLWLRADCLDRVNRPTEAKAARDAADLHAVARDVGILQAVAALDSVALSDLAEAQATRLLRRQADNAWLAATLAERTVLRASRAKQWAVAAKAADEMLLWHTLGGLAFTDPIGDIRGPYRRRIAHARTAMAANDPAAAVAQLNVAVTYLPIDAAAPMEFVPQLIAAGQPAAADGLFDRVWSKQADLCRQYPKAASLRNSAAWMALRCDRRLDEALAFAAEAAALMPENDAILDTYAEALFRAGRKDEALGMMRRVVAQRPDDAAMAERLRGFEQGKIVVPPEPE